MIRQVVNRDGQAAGLKVRGVSTLFCRFTPKELDEQDMEAFLASSDDSEVDEEEETKKGGDNSGKRESTKEPRRWKITEDNVASFRQQLLGVRPQRTLRRMSPI